MGTNVEVHELDDDGTIPNNPDCPLIVYRGALVERSLENDPTGIERLFGRNGWPAAWRNGVFPYHHYHSTSHEVLGCYGGSATLQLGGEPGLITEVRAGDVVVIPAGVGHKRLDSTSDFAVVGAYPEGSEWDMNYAKPGERERASANIRAVPVPGTDPVHGTDGPLVTAWPTRT